MARWAKPSEEYPQCEAGDRIVMIVKERLTNGGPLKRRLVILKATETGWEPLEDVYGGYDPHDGVMWAYEDSVTAVAEVAT